MSYTKSQPTHTPPGLEWEQAVYHDYPVEVQRALYQQRSFVRAALAGIDSSKIRLVMAISDSGVNTPESTSTGSRR